MQAILLRFAAWGIVLKNNLPHNRQTPLSRYIFTSLITLTAILLVLLWVFQVILLEPFYRVIKNTDIQRAAETIEKNLESDDLIALLDHYALNRDINARIFSQVEKEITSSASFSDSYVHTMSASDVNNYYRLAKQSGGTLCDTIVTENIQFKIQPSNTRLPTTLAPQIVQNENILLAKVITDSNGIDRMILLSSRVTPVSSTVDTLKVQISCITITMVILSIVISVIISKRISKPITKTNETAKQLAKGNYSVHFDDGLYREAAELADTLNYAAKELSKAENLRNEIISNISHELRTPITMIIGYAEMMCDIPKESSQENLQIIIDEAKRLSALVNDILDLSKYQAGTQTINKQKINLTDTLGDITQRYSKLVEADDYTINFYHSADVYVYADELKLSQVVYNLIGNAVNYSPDRREINVTQQINGDRVRVEVQDHGPGIPSDKLEHIWDRFYKVDNTKRAKITGTGLGLSIAKNILTLHGADYGVLSTEGVGSTFWFELPIVKDESIQ